MSLKIFNFLEEEGRKKMEKMLFATTKDGQEVVVECFRKDFSRPLEATVIPGRLMCGVEKIGIQTQNVLKQIHHDFKKMGETGWKPDIDLFIRGLLVALEDQKEFIVQRLERHLEEMLEKEEAFVSDRRNVFWWKPDEFFLGQIKYLCGTCPKQEERNFFNKFIKEQTERTGVLMLEVTFTFRVE